MRMPIKGHLNTATRPLVIMSVTVKNKAESHPVTHAFDRSTQEAEIGGQPGLQREFNPGPPEFQDRQRYTMSKNKTNKNKQQNEA